MKNLRQFSTTLKPENKENDYFSMNENQLLEELKKSVRRSKESGTFSAQKLKEMVDAIKFKLSEEQVKRLYNIIDALD